MTATAAAAQTPYAGNETRSIKALSEQQVADLGAGRGMGLALAAEFNGYPGPSHVLELAEKLELSANQRDSVKAMFDVMKAEALPLGSKLIEQEADLDKQFASRTITPESLKASTAAMTMTQGQLRETHLKYHLLMVSVLSPHQMHRYAELRGYGAQTDETSSLKPGGRLSWRTFFISSCALPCRLLRAERKWLRGSQGSVVHPSPTSPLWHPGHAHALTEALASSEVSRIVARHVGAEAGDGESRVERKPCLGRGPRLIKLTEVR